MSGPPGLHEIINRGGVQMLNMNRPGGISTGRHSLPGPGSLGVGGAGSVGQGIAPVRRVPPTPGKLMRLRCRFRPLHDAYLKDGAIVEDDTDVIFVCGDGHQVKAHRVIMASCSKFFAKLFEDQRNEVSVVSVPDIKVDIMKLILHLTYRDRVILTMRQIKEVGEFITLFGMAWTQFGYEEHSGDEPMTSLPLLPVPPKPVDVPKPAPHSNAIRGAPPPPQLQPQGQQQAIRKVYNGPGARPSLQQQNVPPTANGSADEDDQEVEQQGFPQNNVRHSRKSLLTPRAGTEGEGIVEQKEEEDPHNMIQTWMDRLGKRQAPSAPGSGGLAAPGTGAGGKRMRMEEAEPQVKNRCSVCNQQFKSETAWRWHEDRHVGHRMFKCKFCDELNITPKNCWIHERDVHGFSGLVLSGNDQQQPGVQQKQLIQQPAQAATQRLMIRPNNNNLMGVAKFANQDVSKRIKLSAMKKMQGAQKKGVMIANRAGHIGIGDSNGSEKLDSKKLKQLHWLYVCERCKNCADSASKATMHYNRCFPNKEKNFEKTVTKYRQGFYGKSNCPLCPRRYPQNSGFMIHCGHQHQQYRKLFTHIGGTEDQLRCNNCTKQFDEPEGFHTHLKKNDNDEFICPDEPVEEPTQEIAPPPAPAPAPPPVVEKVEKKPATRSSTEGKVTRPRLPRRPDSPMESKSYKVQFHTPPRSARLANRVQAEASAEAAKAKAATPPTTTTDIHFPPVDCPVCGDSDLPNISDHLKSKHKDLNVDVTRISSELLRCKGCTITFDICDLLDHKNCLNPEKVPEPSEENEESNSAVSNNTSATSAPPTRRSSVAASISSAAIISNTKAAKPAPAVVDPDSLPPGVGRSPIEKIEIDDLLSIEAIRCALKCLICGRTAKKLGVIADCLRAHGIHRCSLCFNSYCNKNDYATHLKKCHGSGSNKLKCPLCPKSFANAGQTSGHMYSTHWLQILKQNEQLFAEEAEGGETNEEDKGKSEQETSPKADESSANTSKRSTAAGRGGTEEEKEDEAKEKLGDEDDNQEQVTGILDPQLDGDNVESKTDSVEGINEKKDSSSRK